MSFAEDFLSTLFGAGNEELFYMTTRKIWPWVVQEVGRAEPYGWEFATPYMDQSDRANDWSPEPYED